MALELPGVFADLFTNNELVWILLLFGEEIVLLIEGHEIKMPQGPWEALIYDYGCHLSTGISR